MWDNNAWSYLYGNTSEAEPPFLIQDFIHALQPEARFIAILRDPVERLYSDYLYFGMANKSVEDFQEKVWESLQLFDACLQEFSLRACVYNSTLNNAMPVRLHVGVYVVYVLDWLSVFSADQLLVLRLEDHAADKKTSMNRVFRFLQLGHLSEQKEVEITERPASNTRRLADKNLGPMLPLTRRVLTDFYSPFNRKLATVLQDNSFLWDHHSTHT
ncbi:carbohydrate sulfotransferase 15 isoform X1 [Tachysurus fulvidraco]|uniref:carbohydrate sulfotransferase 15 isoform X1 n=1 Tax=Tachysurus fulvidraco TaxID=1234273 RepID=UPI001FEE52F1|nr:carbohydrate sulfotransferase 15 isoform X1 [Tachysurus fulvidraco]XP_047668813.1 carbohydrate sulfotransferase 15 isoform X1 [Tachysurus fulvidraco]